MVFMFGVSQIQFILFVIPILVSTITRATVSQTSRLSMGLTMGGSNSDLHKENM